MRMSQKNIKRSRVSMACLLSRLWIQDKSFYSSRPATRQSQCTLTLWSLKRFQITGVKTNYFPSHRNHNAFPWQRQPVNDIWGNNRCQLEESYETHNYTLWVKRRVFFNGQAGGTYSNQRVSNLRPQKKKTNLILTLVPLLMFTDYGLDGQGLIPGKSTRSLFSQPRPDRLWVLTSLLSDAYWGFLPQG
jgi:hypothetical protein